MNKEEVQKDAFFTEIYNEYIDAIFRFCYFKTGDKEIAADLSQDVFMKVYKHIETLQGVDNAKSFIYTIAKNTIIDFWRKKKHLHEGDLPEGFISSITAPEKTSTLAEYREFITLLEELSPPEKEVIILRYVEDLSSKEMAELLDERENTILVRISRATKKLQELGSRTEKRV